MSNNGSNNLICQKPSQAESQAAAQIAVDVTITKTVIAAAATNRPNHRLTSQLSNSPTSSKSESWSERHVRSPSDGRHSLQRPTTGTTVIARLVRHPRLPSPQPIQPTDSRFLPDPWNLTS
ncbi:hypothetical protein CDD83_7701 [Cordyceps sp. RAO-2017]|nr:hypothetical protein CDD83_7701 [Cordyceps sp. RAO-2017]